MARRLVKVWLDDSNATDRALLEEINRLKQRRQFTPTFRNAMILELGLEDGESSALTHRFPEIIAELQREHHSLELMKLRAELAELKLQLAGSSIPSVPPKPKRSAPQPRDVKLEVTTSDADDDVAANLIKSLDIFGGL